MRFLPASGAQNPPWQSSGCLHYRIPAQLLSRKLAGEGGRGGILPGQGTAPSPVCADKNSLPGTFPAGCLSGKRGVRGQAGCPQIAVKLSTGGDYSMAFLAACAISAVAFVMALIVRRKVQAVIHS